MVLPSVKRIITLALVSPAGNRASALVKASVWLVEPPAWRPLTAVFRSATEVMSWVSWVAVVPKLTTPMRLPPPIWPVAVPPVVWAIRSMKVFAPSFRLAKGVPVILRERSKISTISVGLSISSG